MPMHIDQPPHRNPPRWAERLVEWMAASHIREEILGDLYELFQKRGRRYGYTVARLLYMLEVLFLIHPRLWRETARSAQSKNTAIYSKPNPTAMLSNYLKVAFRKLNRQKSYTLINTVSLSMGIACAILIFALVKYHLSFDGFHTDKDRIYRIYTEMHGEKVIYNTGVPNPLGQAFRTGYGVAEKIGRIAFLPKRVVSLSPQKKFEEDIAFADPDFLDIFNFPLVEGNLQTALKDRNTAVITAQIAGKYFGSQDPIGQLLRIDDSLVVRVNGVLRDLPSNTDFRSQIFIAYDNLEDHSPWMVEKDWWFSVNKEMQCFVRLKRGVSAAGVDKSILPAISNAHYNKEQAKYFRFRLQPLADIHFNMDLRGKTDKKHLRTFAWIGFFLILTACVNFVNLATAQAVGRSREIGVRKALGSQRGSLFWQFMTETSVIATLALAIAVGLAYLALPFVNQWFEIDLMINPFNDSYLIAFLGILLVTVVFFSGAYPGLIVARLQPVLALKGKSTQKSPTGISLRKGLVVGQFAISQLLIIGTLVITNQLRYSQQANMGFEKDAVIILPVPDNQKSKTTALGDEISKLAGVDKVTFFDTPPATETIGHTSIQFDSRPEAEDFSISVKAADHQYVPMFGIPVLAGRNLSPSDTIREYLLNESAVKSLGLATMQDAIGKTATVNGKPGKVVGVVKDFHFRSLRSAIEPLCLTTRSENYSSCGIKVNLANIVPTISGLEKAWIRSYPSSIFTYHFLDEEIERFYRVDNMLLRLIQVFAAVAILVGCLGLYGLVSFMAAQKTKEIGIRKVLGASTSSILWLFGKEFLALLFIAFLLAAPLAWWVMQDWLSDFAYHIEPGARIFALAILITSLVAALTVGFRSFKASLANPVKTLRSD
ncbi:ABC transporter permease [Dyadobacter sp. CY261]|uniref:ABC transporter permease n=1 Tax=Dyadobacter sp. CY261 TaxID=2907203 RepID=UPI001F3076BE|nr:ABC transporter permease [Dyadobacter sp. CY261]MCF0072944.1 ABC transporter permease [Dyadobacter sp. CY261]